MQNKKSAHPTAATAGRARQGTAAWQAGTSPYHDTTAPPPGQALHVADFLSHGAENGVTLSDLVALTGWREREVRRQIERERRRGIPILSDNIGGYFLPADEEEKTRFIRSMRHRAGEILKSAAAIEHGGMAN